MEGETLAQVGPYTVLRKLADGGMAEVFLATRSGALGFSKRCVLKRIRPEHASNPVFRERFRREAQLAADLHHPNIVQIFDLTSDERDQLFLAMEHVEGTTADKLRRASPGGKLPSRLAARIALEVARALEYAHGFESKERGIRGVTHRDVSPQNILVGLAGEVKLIDFGIAKPTNQRTSLGLLGKVAYLSPEQARSDATDGRTDLFALGVTLFELVTGSRPYPGEDDLAIINELRSGSTRPPLAHELEPEVPVALSELIDTAIQRSPERRFPSAVAMREALLEVLRGENDAERELLAAKVATIVGSSREASAGPTPALFSGATPQLVPTKPSAASGLGIGSAISAPTSPPPPSSLETSSAPNRSTRPMAAFGVAMVLAAGATLIVQARGRERSELVLPVTAPMPAPTSGDPEIGTARLQHSKTVDTTTPRPVARTPSATMASGPSERGSMKAGAPTRLSKVTFRANPFAMVVVDGSSPSSADPFVDVELPAGHHRAVFTYFDQTKAVDFVVVPGQVQQVEATFSGVTSAAER